jgi:excisionase family DNA binding protein
LVRGTINQAKALRIFFYNYSFTKMNTIDLPSLLRIKVAALVLGCSDKTVRRLIDSGKLDTVKIRGLRMVRESSLRVLMEKGTA